MNWIERGWSAALGLMLSSGVYAVLMYDQPPSGPDECIESVEFMTESTTSKLDCGREARIATRMVKFEDTYRLEVTCRCPPFAELIDAGAPDRSE